VHPNGVRGELPRHSYKLFTASYNNFEIAVQTVVSSLRSDRDSQYSYANVVGFKRNVATVPGEMVATPPIERAPVGGSNGVMIKMKWPSTGAHEIVFGGNPHSSNNALKTFA
jgi:hypothetical protein